MRHFPHQEVQAFLVLAPLADVLNGGNQAALVAVIVFLNGGGQLRPEDFIVGPSISPLDTIAIYLALAYLGQKIQIGVEAVRMRQLLKYALGQFFTGVAQHLAEARVHVHQFAGKADIGDADTGIFKHGVVVAVADGTRRAVLAHAMGCPVPRFPTLAPTLYVPNRNAFYSVLFHCLTTRAR